MNAMQDDAFVMRYRICAANGRLWTRKMLIDSCMRKVSMTRHEVLSLVDDHEFMVSHAGMEPHLVVGAIVNLIIADRRAVKKKSATKRHGSVSGWDQRRWITSPAIGGRILRIEVYGQNGSYGWVITSHPEGDDSVDMEFDEADTKVENIGSVHPTADLAQDEAAQCAATIFEQWQ